MCNDAYWKFLKNIKCIIFLNACIIRFSVNNLTFTWISSLVYSSFLFSFSPLFFSFPLICFLFVFFFPPFFSFLSSLSLSADLKTFLGPMVPWSAIFSTPDAYAPRTHSHTTGSDRQLKRSCRLGHSLPRSKDDDESWRVLRFNFPNSEFLTNVLASLHAVFGAFFKLLAPSKNLHTGGGGVWHGPLAACPLCQHATEWQHFLAFKRSSKIARVEHILLM